MITCERNSINGRKVGEYRNIEELTSSIIEEVGILKASSAICSF